MKGHKLISSQATEVVNLGQKTVHAKNRQPPEETAKQN